MANENIYGGQNYINSSFVFDKTYPNLKEAQKRAIDDGVLIGRYILIKYCDTAFDYSTRQAIEQLETQPTDDPEKAKYWEAFQNDEQVSKDRIIYQKIWNNNSYEYQEIANLQSPGIPQETIEQFQTEVEDKANEAIENIDNATNTLNNSAAVLSSAIEEAQKTLVELEPVGQKTLEGGEIFNDYEPNHNQAVSAYSTARGTIEDSTQTENIAGQKGYEIIGVDTEAYYLPTNEGLEANDIFSVIMSSTSINSGKIASIDYVDVGQYRINVIDINDEAFDTLPGDEFKENNSYFFIINKPNVGDIDLGTAARAEGIGNRAVLYSTVAEGYMTSAFKQYAHAEGSSTIAGGHGAHAEGLRSKATGTQSHAEGRDTEASGVYGAHAEGYQTWAKGNYSFASGNKVTAFGVASHAEGGSGLKMKSDSTTDPYSYTFLKDRLAHSDLKIDANSTATYIETQWNIPKRFNMAYGDYSHTEGYDTLALGKYSHTEGYYSFASQNAAHAEGSSTTALGLFSHSEGGSTIASGYSAHAEGYDTTASGDSAHAEGRGTTASDHTTHAEGHNTTASYQSAHAEGSNTTASAFASHAEGSGTEASGYSSHVEGYNTFATATGAHAEGTDSTTASGKAAHAEGSGTVASSNYSHAEGRLCVASTEEAAHAEGQSSQATGLAAHAEGHSYASGSYSHAEGESTYAKHKATHTEGQQTQATSRAAHAEGINTRAGHTADTNNTGIAAHAEGCDTIASGTYSHAGGWGTKATKKAQTAIGKYNATKDTALFIVGNGTSDENRSNAFEVLNSSDNVASATIGGFTVITETSLTEFLANYIKFDTVDVNSTTLPDTCRIYIQVKE